MPLDGFFRSLPSNHSSPILHPFSPSSISKRWPRQCHAGLISPTIAETISSSCRVELIDLPALAQAMPSAGNLAIPLLKQLNSVVARNSPQASRYVHFGATSQDALDTGLVLQLRSAILALHSDLDAIVAALISLSEVHRKTLLVARTWLQHALPTTFGYVTAGWLDAFLQHGQRLDRQRENSRCCNSRRCSERSQLSGIAAGKSPALGRRTSPATRAFPGIPSARRIAEIG
jgi:3-carboxy-cis,cis-muconate cycloisomerase